ncbi:MAG: hypothetical protein C4524_07395 [Candidatus Zixiibacteriota bacterium]|nr:MAG: hypothetical protein C4524_07395 [candidate division Zixibacteria bacterium]
MRRWVHGAALAFILATLAGPAAAQSVLLIKAGSYNPAEAKAGFMVGVVSGRQVDERVRFGLGADLFIRRFKQETEISGDPGTKLTEISYSMYGLPLMAHLDVHFLPSLVVKPYAGLAGGYEIVFSREVNYLSNPDDKDNRLYGGFGWQLKVGAEYPFALSSAVLGEIMYNGCTVQRSAGEQEGLPASEELRFSGLSFRLGVRLEGF